MDMLKNTVVIAILTVVAAAGLAAMLMVIWTENRDGPDDRLTVHYNGAYTTWLYDSPPIDVYWTVVCVGKANGAISEDIWRGAGRDFQTPRHIASGNPYGEWDCEALESPADLDNAENYESVKPLNPDDHDAKVQAARKTLYERFGEQPQN